MPTTSTRSSSDDLVAFSSVPSSQYSYDPPAPGSSVSASPIMSTDILAETSPRKSISNLEGYGRRNMTRQASYAYAMQSVGSLPLYSPREGSSGGAALNGMHAEQQRRRSHSNDDNDEEDTDESDEEDEDDEDNELEMDTLNKNSQGRGGWKMLSNSDGRHYNNPSHSLPGSPTSPRSPTSPNASTTKRKRVPSSDSTITTKQGKQKQGNFEKFQVGEWASMGVSFLLVAALTGIALHICFSG